MQNINYKNQRGSIGSFILDFIQSIVLALAVFVLLYLFVAQPNEVKGNSMYPNFLDMNRSQTQRAKPFLFLQAFCYPP